MQLDLNNQKYEIDKICETELAVYGITAIGGVISLSKKRSAVACQSLLDSGLESVPYADIREKMNNDT